MQPLPVLPPAEPTLVTDAVQQALQHARRFHLGDAAATPTPPADDLLPVLLHAYRGAEFVRGCFPAFVPAEPSGPQAGCVALSHLLGSACPDGSRLLADNLLRVERVLRQICKERVVAAEAAVDAHELLDAAGAALREELHLAAEQDEKLAAEWQQLCAQVPAGRFIGLGPQTGRRLLAAAVRAVRGPRVAAFRERLKQLRSGVHDLLSVEQGKDGGGGVAGLGSQFIDPSALAGVAGAHRGTQRLDAGRRQHLEQTLAVLDRWLQGELEATPDVVAHVLVAADESLLADDDPRVELAGVTDPVQAAAERFDAEAQRFAELFAAVRRAELETAGKYEPTTHDDFLAQFDVDSFRDGELLLLPRIAVFAPATALVGAGLTELLQLLSSGRPVQVVTEVDPGADPLAGADAAAGGRFRGELTAVALGLREVFVQQSTPSRIKHLLRGFTTACDRTRAGLHVLASCCAECAEQPRVARSGDAEAWLRAGAAIEGRAHPLFRYDPEAGEGLAQRVVFQGNPAQIDDWPEEELACRDAEGQELSRTLRFHFADYALLDQSLHGAFHALPEGLGALDEQLVTVDEWLELPAAEASARLPFLWGARADGSTQRLVVARGLLLAARDRRDFWRTLQELAGVRSDYVRGAVDQVRAQLHAEFDAERARLEAEHAAALIAVREAAVRDAMDGLARSLLDLGPGALEAAAPAAGVRAAAPTPQAAAPAAPEPVAEPVAEAAPEPEVEADDEPLADPWVDSPLCTTCNDCHNINPQLFVYDENKQIMLGDVSKGTYAQLVQAAEKCPSRCIHPGLPQDRSEPGVEDLIARAAPFNG